MAQLTLDVGTNANDGTGDTLRDAMVKVNTNFTELFSSPLIASGITVSGNEIRASRSNDDLKFLPSGMIYPNYSHTIFIFIFLIFI